jgi:hypothetical protein
MNRNWLRCFLVLCVGMACTARAQLQFTNVTASGATNFNLYGVTCGGVSNAVAGGSNYIFVAMGSTSSVYILTFSNLLSGLNQNTNWYPKSVPGASLLNAGVFGGTNFLVSGLDNQVYSSPDAVSWTSNGVVFKNNSATAEGLAFNNNYFVAVASAPEINWSTNIAMNAWSNASTFTGLSFADSFRGVTAYNLSGSTGNSAYFAACGVLGRLATTSTGGQIWTTNYGAVGQPDLDGIASDGGQNLVCVGGPKGGSTGSILTFSVTNNSDGALLVTNISNPNIPPLNAVSYIGTNYGFLAVGTNGSVLMISNNGTAWTSTNIQSISALSSNHNTLNGVFFAHSGIFNGVGVLVGNTGTIILAGPTPPTPVNITPAQTNSAGETNSSFVLTNNTIGYPLGTLTVDWATDTNFLNVPAGLGTTNYSIGATNYFVPPVVTSNITTTNIYYARTRDLRTGFVSANFIILTNIVYEQPTIASNLVNSPICNGESDTIQLYLTGHAPWTVTWSDGVSSNYMTNAVSRDLTPGEVADLLTNMATNYTFVVTNLTDRYSTAEVSNFFSPSLNPLASNTTVVTVNPRPTSTTGATDEIANGMPVTLTNVLTGLGSWTVYWTNGLSSVVQYPSDTMPGNYTNTFTLTNDVFDLTDSFPNQAVTNYYWVYALSDANCMADAGDLIGANMVIIDPRPTSATGATNEIANGMPVTLTNVLTGLGAWTVYWTNNYGGSNVQSVTSPGPGNYTNTLTLNSGAFNQTNANPNQVITNYYWVAEVVSSNPATGFLSTNLASDLTGTNVVIIAPRPTSLAGGTNEISGGMTTTITNVLTGIGPWTVYWTNGVTGYVQQVASSVAGPYTNLLSLANTPFTLTNSFPNQVTNYYFWVTQVVSSNTSSGLLSSNLATDLAGTDVVIVDPLPTSTTGGTNVIYNGESTTLTNVLTGLGAWTVYWTDGTNVVAQNVTSSNYMNTLSLPTNSLIPINPSQSVPVTAQYWISGVVSTNQATGFTSSNAPTGLTGTNVVIIDPVLTNAPPTGATVSSCYDVPVPLTVTVPSGFTADWFDSGFNLLTNGVGTNSFTPATPVNLGGNASVTNTFYVAVRFADTNLALTNQISAGYYSPSNSVWLISEDCTNAITSFSQSGTNIVLQWSGNYILETTTNLAPPNWVVPTNFSPSLGTNYWTNSLTSPPINFYRLTSVTN